MNSAQRQLRPTIPHPGLKGVEEDFLVGRWRVYPQQNRIEWSGKGKRSRHLEPRLMQLLCILAKHPDQVLHRETLISSLWPAVVVNENSLTRAVSDLRRKLRHDDTEQQAGYIDTVSKRGYRLTARVAPLDAELEGPKEQERRQQQRRRYRWLPEAAVAAGLTLSIALFSLYSTDYSSLDEPGLDSSALIETDPSENGRPAIYGRYEPAMEPAPRTRALRSLAYDMPTFRGGSNVAVSPDGSLYAFTRHVEEGSSLLIGSVESAREPLLVFHSEELIHHLQWSPVGNAVLFALSPRRNQIALFNSLEQGRLMLFDLDNFAVRELYHSGERDPDDSGSANPFNMT